MKPCLLEEVVNKKKIREHEKARSHSPASSHNHASHISLSIYNAIIIGRCQAQVGMIRCKAEVEAGGKEALDQAVANGEVMVLLLHTCASAVPNRCKSY